MKTRLLIILLILGTVTLIYPASAFACSLAFDVGFLTPWNEYLHGDCSITTGTISWIGMIYIMLAFIAPIIIIKRKKKLRKRFYLLIPVTIFVVMFLYSVFIYDTADITSFAIPHGIYGGIDYDSLAWLDTRSNFAKMLADRNVSYSEQYFGISVDYKNHEHLDSLEYQNKMPANYCGFVIAENGDEYWYTAIFDKTIISSEIYLENPFDCNSDTEECTCNIQERVWEDYDENEN